MVLFTYIVASVCFIVGVLAKEWTHSEDERPQKVQVLSLPSLTPLARPRVYSYGTVWRDKQKCVFTRLFFFQVLRDIRERPESATPRPGIRSRGNMSLKLEYIY